MEEAESGPLEFICALFAGAACTNGGPAPDLGNPCLYAPYAHVYRLRATEATAPAALEAALAVLERRMLFTGTCSLEARIEADGTVVLQAVGLDANGPLLPFVLEPGVVGIFPVLDPNTPAGPGIAVLPGAGGEPVTVRWQSLLGPDAIEQSVPLRQPDGQWIVRAELADEAAAAFGDATAALVGSALAIVVDNRVVLQPRLMEPIRGGRLDLAAGFGFEEALRLSAVLDSGPLTVALELLSVEQVPLPVAGEP